jgi:PQ loop repeat
VLLYLWVTIKAEREAQKPQLEVKERFWNWTNYTDYLLFICSLAASIGFSTILMGENHRYQALIALSSSGIEAILGAPQFYLNYQRQNTSGLS